MAKKQNWNCADFNRNSESKKKPQLRGSNMEFTTEDELTAERSNKLIVAASSHRVNS